MCSALTGQVGQSWPLYIHVEQSGDAITLLFSEDAPPDPTDPFAGPPEKFVGTRTGDSITATLVEPSEAMGCPSDAAPTPETGGQLTAAVSGNQISGDFTDVFGTGAAEVKFLFHFTAAFAPVQAAKAGR